MLRGEDRGCCRAGGACAAWPDCNFRVDGAGRPGHRLQVVALQGPQPHRPLCVGDAVRDRPPLMDARLREMAERGASVRLQSSYG